MTSTLKKNNFDNGTDGSALTVSSSTTSGDTLAYSAVTGTATRTYDNDHAHTGTLAGKIVANTSSSLVMGYSVVTNDTCALISVYFYFEALPSTAEITVLRIHHSGDARVASVAITTTGQVKLYDAADAVLNTSTAILSTGTWYRLELLADPGTTTSNGRIACAFYVGNSTTPVETAYDSSTVNAGTTATLGSTRFGKLTTTGSTTMWVDSVQSFSDTSALSLGNPWPSNGVAEYQLTQNYTPNTNTVTTLVVDATASVGIVTLSQLSGTTASVTESPTGVFTITNPTGTDNLTFRVTATGNTVDTADFTWARNNAGSTTIFSSLFVKQSDNSWAPTPV